MLFHRPIFEGGPSSIVPLLLYTPTGQKNPIHFSLQKRNTHKKMRQKSSWQLPLFSAALLASFYPELGTNICPPIKTGTFESMIFLLAPARICLPSFPGGYLHPRKSKIVIPKMVTFQARRSFFFGRAHHFEGPNRSPKEATSRGFIYTPRR